jgi:hypothetical protein
MGTLAASDMEVTRATGPGAPTFHALGGAEDGEMRRFRLIRAVAVSGVSGIGVVAECVLFSTGKVVLSWCSEYRSVTINDTVSDLEIAQGHGGRTRIEWLDPNDQGEWQSTRQRLTRAIGHVDRE